MKDFGWAQLYLPCCARVLPALHFLRGRNGQMVVVGQEGLRPVEPEHVRDIFASALAEVEDIGGGCMRFTFTCREHIDGQERDVVVAKLIAPVEAVPPALLLAAKAIGMTMAGNMMPQTGLH